MFLLVSVKPVGLAFKARTRKMAKETTTRVFLQPVTVTFNSRSAAPGGIASFAVDIDEDAGLSGFVMRIFSRASRVSAVQI